jgi:hypothetical protein
MQISVVLNLHLLPQLCLAAAAAVATAAMMNTKK